MLRSATPFRPPAPGAAVLADAAGQALSAIDVWTISLDAGGADVVAAAAVLDAAERARAARFVFERDRTAFTIARAALRHILAGYVGLPADRVPLCTGTFGKPQLGDPCHLTGVQFNVAHSGQHALVAVTRQRAIGIDIEHVRPMHDLDGVAAIVLSPAEYRVFTDCTPDDRLELFLGAWTRKEAYLKARGEGLARSPTLLECSALLGGAETIRDPDDDSAARRWSVMTWCGADYRAALVAEGPLGTVTFK